MQVNVNIITDFTVGMLSHFQWVPPLPLPTPTPMPSIEVPATQLWTLGYVCKQNKFTDTGKQVLHKGLFIMQDGHNTGMMIPDLTVPPAPNAQYPIMWPFSTRKVNFGASTVKMLGIAVGCSQMAGLPPIPQMTCGDPMTAPTVLSMITATNTLSVGMTLADLIIGIVACGVAMIIDRVVYKAYPPGAQASLTKGIVNGIVGKVFPIRNPGQMWKRVLGAVAGFDISVLKGNPSFKLVLFGGKDGGPLSVEVEYKHGDDGSNKATLRGTALGQPAEGSTTWGD